MGNILKSGNMLKRWVRQDHKGLYVLLRSLRLLPYLKQGGSTISFVFWQSDSGNRAGGELKGQAMS